MDGSRLDELMLTMPSRQGHTMPKRKNENGLYDEYMPPESEYYCSSTTTIYLYVVKIIEEEDDHQVLWP